MIPRPLLLILALVLAAGLVPGFLLAPVPAAAQAVPPLATELATAALSGDIFATAPPGDTERLFIVEYVTARIRILKNGVLLTPPFIDINPLVINTADERGLLGLAFHPDYATNGFFYVYYIDNAGDSIVSRYTVSANPDVADDTTAQIILTVDQPFGLTNHKGGTLAFGPNDGYLYIALGDGGNSLAAQDDSTLLGKMLRIDVDGGTPYAIPPTNPFVGPGDPLDEIWAKGFRNPFRWSFDRETGDIYIGDVGQNTLEEIDFQDAASTGGENYGWRFKEGTACFNPPTGCDPGGLTDPIHEYVHPGGRCAVTGGAVYRGCAVPELQGTYFFADFCTAEIWSFRYDGATLTDFTDRTTELDPPGALSIASPVAFGEDGLGELYVVALNGEIYKIVPATVPDCNANSEPDGCDIAGGTSLDLNANGIPDECAGEQVALPALSARGAFLWLLLLPLPLLFFRRC
ncbi:MAG: PQQ-dependent sugar dehydrogenase [Deltaproteobacteria bacterium]|nr:PQQ-dependent sugar dehydrogenase [Deltaproteobacteria bacterium]